VQTSKQGPTFRPAGLRTLQQIPPNVTAVSSPHQLLNVSTGDTHIEIQQHLDLTTVDPLDTVNPGILGPLTILVQSIRVCQHVEDSSATCMPHC
jgi:hypothetical protein